MTNRLSTLACPPPSSVSAAARPLRPAAATAEAISRPSCSHNLLAPLHYESNYSYPLLIWLHSPGGDERELAKVMPLISLRNYVSLSVRGAARDEGGYEWLPTTEGIHTAEQGIAEALVAARRRFNIHAQRVFLAGYASGGTMALRLALRNPGLYAGAASLGGAFPEGQAPLARLAEARQSRLLIEHQRDSLSYPIEKVCRELSLFHAAGMCVTLRQYPCGDELTTTMLHDLNVWLMEQVTGVAAEEQEHVPLPSDWN
jgi:phospholipase/carboxylesterase